jgi:hypothetical protein
MQHEEQEEQQEQQQEEQQSKKKTLRASLAGKNSKIVTQPI